MRESEKLDLILEKVNTLDDKVSALDEKVNTLDDKVSALDEKVNTLDDKVSMLDEKVNTLDDKVSMLDEKVNTLDDKVSALDDKENALDEKVTDMEAGLQEVRQRVRNTGLIIENEIRVNLQRVAEGHLDLSRNLHEAMRPGNEVEVLSIKVRMLETDVKNIKEKLA